MSTTTQECLSKTQQQTLYARIHERAAEVDMRIRGLAFRTLWNAAKAPFGVVSYRDIPAGGYTDAVTAVETVDLSNMTPDRVPTLTVGQLRHKKWTAPTRAALADPMIDFLEGLEAVGVPCKGALFIWKSAYRGAAEEVEILSQPREVAA